MATLAYKAGQNILGKLRGFRRDRRGATAIEFAMLALPFALLSFAILETTVSFTAQQVIGNATDKIARQIRTGQLTVANTTESQFRAKICDEISLIVGAGCPQLLFDLQNYSKFQDVPRDIPIGPDGDIDPSGFKYDPGGEETINSLRIFYRWPVMTDVMKPSMANLPNGNRLLFSTATWQNEPF
jgi:Flp pilus assembly protein TadG